MEVFHSRVILLETVERSQRPRNISDGEMSTSVPKMFVGVMALSHI